MNKFKKKEAVHSLSLKSLWLMLCLLFVGTGSAFAEDDVVSISSVEDLQALATLVNTPNGTATKGKTYELTADLDMTGVEWTPIGNVDAYPGRSFQGIFDGKNHTISNLKCIDHTVNYACAALFGSASGATIKNVTLKNVDIQSTHWAAGILAYHGDETVVTITNCHIVGGSIVSTPELVNGSYDNGDKVGSVVGYTTNATIENCSVEGVTLQAYRDLGGLGGYITAGNVVNNTVKDVTLIQDNTNGYKKNTDGSLQDMSGTVGLVVGGRSGSNVQTQANNTEQNTTENVVISNPDAIAKIGAVTYPTLVAAIEAANEGDVVEICKADTYTVPNISKNITIKGAVEGVIFDCTHHAYGYYIANITAAVTFENVTMNLGNENYVGFDQNGAGTQHITMKDCTLNGRLTANNDMDFIHCTFNAPGTEASGISNKDYSLWTWGGDLTFTECTFNCAGKCVNVYTNDNATTIHKIKASNCTFNSTVANKAAFNVKASNGSNTQGFEVSIENCEATGSWPTASESESLVVLNALVQVDDINADVASSIEVIKITEDNEEVLYTTHSAEYNGNRYNTLKEALDAAAAAGDKNIVVNLLNDAELPIGAWNGSTNSYSIGTEETESITINGNDHKLTFMTTNTDWNNVATMNDAQTKIILNNMTIDQGGKNTKTTWNSYDIVFHSAVELNHVTSNRPVAFENSATVNDLTINTDTSVDAYAIWISPRAENQTINIDGLNLTGKRGIKIDDQYVTNYGDVENVKLNITNATFNTAKKAAILVKSSAETNITASNLDITNVTADNDNAVWVDEAVANAYDLVTFTSEDATMIPEGGVSAYSITRATGDNVNGYYTDLAKATAEVEEGQVINLLENVTLTKNINITKSLSLNFNGNSLTGGTIALGTGVTLTTDAQVENYESLFVTTNENEVIVEAQNGEGKYTYTVESNVAYELTDGTACPYDLTSDIKAKKVTYTRSFAENRVNKKQSWFLPFDYTITAADTEKFTFYEIYMISNSAKEGEIEDDSKTWIFIKKMNEGEVLKANTPYLYVPKEVMTDYVFESEHVTLKAKTDGVVLSTATTKCDFSFYGTYSTVNLKSTADYTIYYMDINGQVGWSDGTKDIACGPYRWYIKRTNKSGNPSPARTFIFYEEDDNTTTGLQSITSTEESKTFYTLDGVKVGQPRKGLYIRQSANGETKKIYIK